jgi:hypothetical protein
MELKERKEITKEVIIGHKCDDCGKEIIGALPLDWCKITAHHHEWGNDWEDSYSYNEICSIKCFISKIKELVSEYEEYPSSLINETPTTYWKQLLEK